MEVDRFDFQVAEIPGLLRPLSHLGHQGGWLFFFWSFGPEVLLSQVVADSRDVVKKADLEFCVFTMVLPGHQNPHMIISMVLWGMVSHTSR